MIHVPGTNQEYTPPMDMFSSHPTVPTLVRLFLPCEGWNVQLGGQPLKFNKNEGFFKSNQIDLREEIELCAKKNGCGQVTLVLSIITDTPANGSTPIKIKVKRRTVGPEGTPSSGSGDVPESQHWDFHATLAQGAGPATGVVGPIPDIVVLDVVPDQLDYRPPPGDPLKEVGTDEALATLFELPGH